MERINLDQDIKPLSEFRANAALLVQQVRDTKRPLVITQHGRSAAVLMDVAEYESMLEKMSLLEDVHKAEKEISDGKGVPHSVASERLLKRLKR
jgi:antitoxin YefM